MDFRTHFVAVLSWPWNGTPLRFELKAGELRAARDPLDCGKGSDVGPPAHRYLIQSFPRSAVKTVNGLPLPAAR